MNLYWVVIGGIVLATLVILIRVVKKAGEAEHSQSHVKELNASVDAMANATHRQEKREADHEARLAEIIRGNNLDLARINSLLNSYSPESEAAKSSGS